MKRILYLSVVCLGALLWACQSDGNNGTVAQDGGRQTDVLENPGAAPDAATQAALEVLVAEARDSIVIDDAVKIEGAELLGADLEGFALNAFPPMLSRTDYHAGAWLRDDCLLCHGEGFQGAPLVRHRGMSEALLVANCRTCHVAADPDAGSLTNLAGEEVVSFLSNAFPPSLPVDDSHSVAWTRKDCLTCHQLGNGGVPKVKHHGMSDLLLKANCRSCHLPGVDSALTDIP